MHSSSGPPSRCASPISCAILEESGAARSRGTALRHARRMDERRIAALFARTPGLTASKVHAALAQAGDLAGAAELIGGSRARKVNALLLDRDLRWLERSRAAAVICTSS